MARLDSNSTIDDIEAEYDDCACWSETRDVALAKRFVTACRLLLRKTPKASAKGGASHQLMPELIRDEMQRAQQFIDQNDTSVRPNGGYTHASLRRFRT